MMAGAGAAAAAGPAAARRASPGRRLRLRLAVERRSRALAGLVAFLALAGWAALRFATGEVRPSSPAGNAFGIAAATLLALAMLYALRRRSPRLAARRGLGSARAWLLLHVYAGLLFLLLLALHAGLRQPHGLLSWALWGLAVWTVASGLGGLLVQRTVPRLLAGASSAEVHYDRIPALVAEVRERCEGLVAGGGRPVELLYLQQLAPAFEAPRRDLRLFLHGVRGRRRLEAIDQLRSLLPAAERGRLDALERLFKLKLELDIHYTLQQLLRAWLWLHVPTAALLFVLVVVHVATVIYY